MNSKNKKSHETLSYEAISRELFERYESLYVVNIETAEYKLFYESDSYSSLELSEAGDDFFGALKKDVLSAVHPDDQQYVYKMLTKEALLSTLEKEKYYSFVYRLIIKGKPLYHKLRATKGYIDNQPYFLIGIRDVDKAFRQDKAQTEELSVMHRKEKNYLEAILASAESYMGINLSKNTVLEFREGNLSAEASEKVQRRLLEEPLPYSSFEKAIAERIVENKEKYIAISDREYLIKCFEQGEKRASVSFSIKEKGTVMPCKKVYFLHKDTISEDIMSFCVVYDLTEQQRREKELQDLENKLQLSRIRNFTSQMQPHFLYNALGSIQEIILDDPQYAYELIGDFSIHLRSCIRAMSSDSVIPFEQELSNIKAYVNIEKMRFGDKLRVVYEIKTQDFSILPLSVQPIVENAIRHGIYERGEAGGTVVIRTDENDKVWKITVEDNGVGFDTNAGKGKSSSIKKDSTGLKNITFRLNKVMHARVKIKSIVGTGTSVTIRIPKENRDESNSSR